MQTTKKQLPLTIVAAISILMGIEATQGMESGQKNINHPLYTMMTNASEAMLPYFSPEDRINIFSTCHDLNNYGIENYYREKNSVLKTIGWYHLQFPSTGALVRFNMHLVCMTKLFKSFCDFNDEANPQKYKDRLAGTDAWNFYEMRDHGIPVLSENKESIESQYIRKKTLQELSLSLIKKADNAHPKGILATYTGVTFFEDYSPLHPLLRWVGCCVNDQVQIKYTHRLGFPSEQSEEERQNLMQLHNTIQMTEGAANNLNQYCDIIRRYQEQPRELYSAEIGFHAYFFIDWLGLQEQVVRHSGDIFYLNHSPDLDELTSKYNRAEKISPKHIDFSVFCTHPSNNRIDDVFLAPFYMHPHFYILLEGKINNDCFNQGHAYSILRLARFANKETLVKKILEHEKYDAKEDWDLFYLNLRNNNGSSQ